MDLAWLPEPEHWTRRMQALSSNQLADPETLLRLAGSNLDFVRTGTLDRAVMAARAKGQLEPLPHTCRLAVLGSATLSHLDACIRIAGLRRRMHVDIHQGAFGQYWQETFADASPLAVFAPSAVLLSLDPWHLTGGLPPEATARQRDTALTEMLDHIVRCWSGLQDRFRCQVILQLPLPVFAPGAMPDFG